MAQTCRLLSLKRGALLRSHLGHAHGVHVGRKVHTNVLLRALVEAAVHSLHAHVGGVAHVLHVSHPAHVHVHAHVQASHVHIGGPGGGVD